MPRRRRSGTRATADAGRVIAGTARGIRLEGPGEGTRPLGDRVKQTLFAILEPHVRDRPFVDLYAGSGAAGIEALSRGASHAVFVESDADAVAAIERNLAATGFEPDRATVVAARVSSWLLTAARPGRLPHGPAAVVFADPPYEHPVELDRTLKGLTEEGRDGVLATDGIVVAKHFWKEPPIRTPLLRSVRQERFGETMLTFYRWEDEDTA